MIAKWLVSKERRKLEVAAAQSEWNKKHIHNEQAKLKKELIQNLGSPQGLALSFGAGCAAVLAFRNKEQLAQLQDLPWSEILVLVQEYSTLAKVQQFEES
ncbi:MAG: hypothetical protein DHS20C12_00820 [Pseudohongiella sp.]|nr:MAG: hypothetical protein DHS20C12_00820 [Pseudohongiella sp.]